MKIILEYNINWKKWWEVFTVKWASAKQQLEIRRKIINSFTKIEIDINKIWKNIMNSKSVEDLLG